MLIDIIHNDSLPDSSSTTYPMGASLSDSLFSFVLEKYIVIICDVCGLRSPSFESSSVLYISPTDTCYMQNLILQGLKQKLQKSSSWYNKNIYYNFQNIYFSLIDLDILIIMSPKIDAPNLWIGPLGLVPFNLDYGLLSIIMDRQYIPVTILHISIVPKKILLQRSHNYGVWNYW